MREALTKVGVEVLGVKDSGAGINRVTDGATGAVDSTITIGDTIDIEGDKVRIAGDAEGVGVFFIDASGAVTQATGRLRRNDPKFVQIQVPATLSKGTVHYGYRPAERTPYHRIRTPAYYFRRRGRRRQARNRIASSLYEKICTKALWRPSQGLCAVRHKIVVTGVKRALCKASQRPCEKKQLPQAKPKR